MAQRNAGTEAEVMVIDAAGSQEHQGCARANPPEIVLDPQAASNGEDDSHSNDLSLAAAAGDLDTVDDDSASAAAVGEGSGTVQHPAPAESAAGDAVSELLCVCGIMCKVPKTAFACAMLTQYQDTLTE